MLGIKLHADAYMGGIFYEQTQICTCTDIGSIRSQTIPIDRVKTLSNSQLKRMHDIITMHGAS